MQVNKNIIVVGLLKAELVANTLLMYLCYHSFNNNPTSPMDPIQGGTRNWWMVASLAAFGVSALSIFSKRKEIRSSGLAVSSLLLLTLGVTYLLTLPTITLGIWFILILGAFLAASAGLIYFLPENLKNLVDLNSGILALEKNVLTMHDSLKQLEAEVGLLKEKILDEQRDE